ncbi:MULTISPECIES: ABC transporter ATP-binding protein [unclassified Breznakia]|uniref:ABC transporter ATP-binding protein n=1 Tax=unclassified Breznakia TaxID=2623764 RepID=UPI0024756AEE|nr:MULTISPECIES: ABC transporter ATP-binding protein [unclassified Breznakia]MDH6367691.1 ABC-2 type transport system ATP-binding protein [Breznakia sp. PH1-1]MDH6404779.1 ABC-2 type transport system ATP-binding protein [Breznakia sp. PF1-11]MDH6412514.1 ABC-2 type transport system ATP-binding protein [Breznakia sp. PFB1-11]MDH6414874.1 ABC-2 type transport system ATP-binding protein [Breznakia sp. PFB1-14]MDH6417185.1 ABC-2 type transport system ATP-binding protein [Breznakia sp. PFB1-4]
MQIQVEKLTRVFTRKKGIIHKTKTDKVAVDGISFEVNKGEVFALLGPNGAGKTTTIKILSTLLSPTSGKATVLGKDCYIEAKQIREHINFIFGGESGVYRRLTGKENLIYFASLYHIDCTSDTKRVNQLLELVGLMEAKDQKVETYSKGMIQRLQIARGLINNPKVLFLDEPTLGLDPIGARDLRNIIQKLKQAGTTILLTTHDMNEADILSDRIAIIKEGKIIALDTPVNLKKQIRDVIEIEATIKELPETQLITWQQAHDIEIQSYIQKQGVIQLHVKLQNMVVRDNFIKQLTNYGLLGFQQKEDSLEDVYIRIIEENI